MCTLNVTRDNFSHLFHTEEDFPQNFVQNFERNPKENIFSTQKCITNWLPIGRNFTIASKISIRMGNKNFSTYVFKMYMTGLDFQKKPGQDEEVRTCRRGPPPWLPRCRAASRSWRSRRWSQRGSDHFYLNQGPYSKICSNVRSG
jgi:hypothetical protein